MRGVLGRLLLVAAGVVGSSCAVEDDGGGGSSDPDAGRRADSRREGNDTGPVVVPPGCGDGAVAGDEDCDGNASVDVTCGDLGLGNGLVRCSEACSFDFSQCSTCGNGRLDGAEECDTEGIAGDCTQVGMGEGSLFCRSDCRFDTRQCSSCGNGQLDDGESCDGTLFREGCESQGLGGTPLCTDCQGNFATCHNLCGNGQIDDEVGEDCDGANVGNQTCAGLGWDVPASPSCSAACELDTTPCSEFQECGNGIMEGDEACDGEDLPTCRQLGFEWGQTQCWAGCTLYSEWCSDAAPFCGIHDHGWGSGTGELGPSTLSRETYELGNDGALHYYRAAGAYFQAGEGASLDVAASGFEPWLLIFDGSCQLIAQDFDGYWEYGPAETVTSLTIVITSQDAADTGEYDVYVQWIP